MSRWKNISGLSDQKAKQREAAFEAEMLAALQTNEPQPRVTSATPPNPIRNGIQISVTENGRTTQYNELELVPLPVRQQILNVWQPRPRVTEQVFPPVGNQPPLPAGPTRSLRFAMALNLLFPGAGQFYMRQPAWGSVYSIGFVACLTTMMFKFLRAYSEYLRLSTNGEIMESGNLEHLSQVFPIRMLLTLTVVGIVIYFVSSIHLALSSRSK